MISVLNFLKCEQLLLFCVANKLESFLFYLTIRSVKSESAVNVHMPSLLLHGAYLVREC